MLVLVLFHYRVAQVIRFLNVVVFFFLLITTFFVKIFVQNHGNVQLCLGTLEAHFLSQVDQVLPLREDPYC